LDGGGCGGCGGLFSNPWRNPKKKNFFSKKLEKKLK
jgi:hypothetical protein